MTEYENDSILSLRYGLDDNEGSLSGIDLGLPFISGSRVDTYYSQIKTDLVDAKTEVDQYGLTWLSDTQHTLAIGLGYEFTGKQNIVEIEDKLFIGQYSESSWFLQLKYVSGRLKAYTAGIEDEGPVRSWIHNRLQESVTIERSGLGMTAGVYGDDWSLKTGLTFYDYSRDLSSIRERLAQYYFKTGVVDQIFQLSNRDLYSDIMFLSDTYSLLFGIRFYDLHVENRIDRQAYAQLELPFSDTFSIGTMLSYAADDSSIYSEVSLSFYW